MSSTAGSEGGEIQKCLKYLSFLQRLVRQTNTKSCRSVDTHQQDGNTHTADIQTKVQNKCRTGRTHARAWNSGMHRTRQRWTTSIESDTALQLRQRGGNHEKNMRVHTHLPLGRTTDKAGPCVEYMSLLCILVLTKDF